jgi:hypothetical protein
MKKRKCCNEGIVRYERMEMENSEIGDNRRCKVCLIF